MKTKTVVVAGATGKLGRLVVESLLAHPGIVVRALVRDPEKARDLKSDRVELVAFDVATKSEQECAAVVNGAFAVVSTLQGGPDVIIDAQWALLQAAKAAGVRRFIPSDYSYNIFSLPAGINVNSDWRRSFAEKAFAQRSDGFEVVHVMQGIFADRAVLGFLGVIDAEQGIVRYWGDGTTPIDWTTWEDTARFTAAAAIDDRPVPEHLFVSGDRIDILTFIKTWENVHGKPLVVQPLGSLEDLAQQTNRALAEQPQNMMAWLPLMYARGTFGGEALLGPRENHRYPEIKPETVEQAMRRKAV